MDNPHMSENPTSDPTQGTPEQQAALQRIHEQVNALRTAMQQVVVGQEKAIDWLFAALVAGGHVLLEGVPGIAKTVLAKTLAKTIEADFSRIQFTPDLMPSDVMGTTVYSMQSGDFTFKPGPVFGNVILIDEINRSPAKTQAALFEVMEERQVTVDGTTHKMTDPFFVMATQNPIEQEGTYKLPEAQLDRFLFRIVMEYPSLEEETAILSRFRDAFQLQPMIDAIEPIFSASSIAACRAIAAEVAVSEDILRYIAQIVTQTRQHPDLYLGASPRASLAILRTAKAIAAMEGRFFVTPDDVQEVCYPVLNHRILLTSEKELEGATPFDVIKELLAQVEVPR